MAAAKERGYDATTKAGVVLEWLKNGPEISDKHVGAKGSHRDNSTTLRLDGIANR